MTAARAALALLCLAWLAACGDTPSGGTCGRACPDGTVCERGACVMPPCETGFADCNGMPADGCEVELGSDPMHCGACGTSCTAEHAGAACVGGGCVIDTCAPGFADCDHAYGNGCEIDLTGNPMHCGACEAACDLPRASAVCVDRACDVGTCAAGFDDCDGMPGNGCEADLGTVATCGGCTTTCAGAPHATPTCGEPGCGLACDPGFDDCDHMAGNGCEEELATSERHCGTCGNPCAAGEVCENGACTMVTCTAPMADCNQVPDDGCEVNLATDGANCGVCGNDCPAGAVCSAGACTYACMNRPDDPVTGQKCPIATPCTAYPQCGTQLGSPVFKYWYCSPTLHTCQYLPQTNGFVTAAGTCTGQLVIRQLANAPWDKRIVPPDGVAFRTATSVAIEVTNTTATDLYLDQLPLTLELTGTNPSRFDVNAVRMYQVGNISDHGDGNNATILVCSSPTTPFGASTSFTLGTGATGGCGGSAFSRVRAGSSQRFILNLAFAATATFIEGRQYRLKIAAPLTGVRARTSTAGASAAYTACPLPAAGITGAYLIFEDP